MDEKKLPTDMHVSDACLAKTFKFEGKDGLQPDGTWHAYKDPAGVPTIYYGLTKGVKMGMVVTEAEAKRMLDREIATYELAIAREVKVPLSQDRYDAAWDFTYNCGEGALANVVKHSNLNAGRYDAVPAQILQYTHYHDEHTRKLVFSSGLRARRVAEVALWNHVQVDVEIPAGVTMPQAPKRGPVAPVIVSTVARSWTIRGALLGILGTAGHAFESFTGIASSSAVEIQGQVDQAGPFKDLLGRILGHEEAITLGLVAIGLVIVISRKLGDTAAGKVA